MTANKNTNDNNPGITSPKAIKTGPKEAKPELTGSYTDAPVVSVGLFSMKTFNCDRDLPIVFSPKYDIYLFGVELLHQFDSKKYSKIANYLNSNFQDTRWARHALTDEMTDSPDPEDAVNPRKLRFLKPNRAINIDELTYHHDAGYLNQVHQDKSIAARILEIWAINLLPVSAIETRLLDPLKLQVSGSIFAAHLAIQNGWSINLGGGFHQASVAVGETFCIFSDVCLLMKYLWRKHPLQKFMIIDLDAHQATGIEQDLATFPEKKRRMVYMLDIFNSTIQPPNASADKGVDLRVELGRFTGDETYLKKLESALDEASKAFNPSLVIYIAGQDVLKDDPLGMLNITETGLLRRDELVFSWATKKHKYPIVMLLGGGFTSSSAKLVADSIKNLYSKGLIWGGHRSGERSLSRPRRKLDSHGSSGSSGKSTFKNLTPAHQTGAKSHSNHNQTDHLKPRHHTAPTVANAADKPPAHKSNNSGGSTNQHQAKKSA